MLRSLFGSAILALFLVVSVLAQPPAEVEVITPAKDTSVAQLWTSEFGYSFTLPNRAKFNKLGSKVVAAGGTETANFILPGGSGSITIRNFAEGRMIPAGFRYLDSIHVSDRDSIGQNGMIHRRVYILTDMAVQIDILLTDKGTREYGTVIAAIMDSFVPPAGASKTIPAWRYGRDPREFERGRYEHNKNE